MNTKERRTVRIDLDTFSVYQGVSGPRKRIGVVTEYVENDGARTPGRGGKPGGKFTSRRLTVRFSGDDRKWVGQFKNGEKTVVILRPVPNTIKGAKADLIIMDEIL